MITIDPLLRPTNAAEMIGVAPKTLSDWRLHGLGPAFLRVKTTRGVESSIRYRVSDLRTFIDDLTIPESRRAKALRERKAKTVEGPKMMAVDIEMDQALFERVRAAAARLGISVNDYVIRVLEAFR